MHLLGLTNDFQAMHNPFS